MAALLVVVQHRLRIEHVHIAASDEQQAGGRCHANHGAERGTLWRGLAQDGEQQHRAHVEHQGAEYTDGWADILVSHQSLTGQS